MKNDKDTMKESNAGMTGGTNGALGGASATDLQKGFIPEQPAVEKHEWDMPMLTEKPKEGGFVGRPEGWER